VLAVACTELSVLASSLEAEVPVIDALDVLTRAIVEFAN
jgi:aspartate/glutamate racemase